MRGRLEFLVEELFQIKDVGLGLVVSPKSRLPFDIEISLTVVRPDGSEIQTSAVHEEVPPYPENENRSGFRIPILDKSAAPVGSHLLIAEEYL